MSQQPHGESFMKNILLLLISICFLALSLSATANDTIRLSTPTAKDETSETFGAPLNTDLEKVTLRELSIHPTAHLGEIFQIETKIAKVCQKKGCFFIAQQDDDVIRVSFKDYGFFIPTDSSGKTVLMTGELVQKQVSKEQAKHFAADLQSDSADIRPGVVYEIVADSIKIPLS